MLFLQEVHSALVGRPRCPFGICSLCQWCVSLLYDLYPCQQCAASKGCLLSTWLWTFSISTCNTWLCDSCFGSIVVDLLYIPTRASISSMVIARNAARSMHCFVHGMRTCGRAAFESVNVSKAGCHQHHWRAKTLICRWHAQVKVDQNIFLIMDLTVAHICQRGN